MKKIVWIVASVVIVTGVVILTSRNKSVDGADNIGGDTSGSNDGAHSSVSVQNPGGS